MLRRRGRVTKLVCEVTCSNTKFMGESRLMNLDQDGDMLMSVFSLFNPCMYLRYVKDHLL